MNSISKAVVFLAVALLLLPRMFAADPATAPLRVHPQNTRYFTDGSTNGLGALRVVYLTGSHTWANLIDRGPVDPPPAFDFHGYLDFLVDHHHNFIRLWGRQVSWYHDYGEEVLYAAPLAWARTGPGTALDGKPTFDLTKLDQSYFDRLRARVVAARERGIYVGIMLFGGSYECRGGWRGNPFNASNNINGVDGDPSGDGAGLESHTLDVPAITRLQEAYLRKVIDNVNDLDNVLYEISNEGEDLSRDWQYHVIRFIHEYEAQKSKRHPVGMTAIGSGDVESNRALFASPAEWVWKAFCQGHHPILMEHLPPESMRLKDCPLSLDDPGYIASRWAMGQARRLAERINLAAMAPRTDLASSGYCLADPGAEYVVYVPGGGEVTVDLTLVPGTLAVEWLHPVEGNVTPGAAILGGAKRALRAPFAGAAVLHLGLKNSESAQSSRFYQ